jgi:hypothetical protein
MEMAHYLRGCLHFQRLAHDFLRSPVTERGVKTSLIMAELDPGVMSLQACRNAAQLKLITGGLAPQEMKPGVQPDRAR